MYFAFQQPGVFLILFSGMQKRRSKAGTVRLRLLNHHVESRLFTERALKLARYAEKADRVVLRTENQAPVMRLAMEPDGNRTTFVSGCFRKIAAEHFVSCRNDRRKYGMFRVFSQIKRTEAVSRCGQTPVLQGAPHERRNPEAPQGTKKAFCRSKEAIPLLRG